MRQSVIILFLFFFGLSNSHAQTSSNQPKVIQFSGVVAEGDSLFGIPGAAVISLKSGTGTNTNLMGYFSLPVFEGDSVLIACLGYKKRYIVIPKDTNQSYSIIIKMLEDTLILPQIDLFVFPSEETFKEIFLAMELSGKSDYANMQSNLNEQIMARITTKMDIPASVTFRNSLDKQAQLAQQKYVYTTNPLLDPFAWARFLNEVKLQKERKEREEKEKKSNTSYR
jgi:hypothetical protein